MNLGTAQVIRANARHLPLADNSVDLVITSPPYFALRSYQDGCSTCHGSPDSYRVKTCSGCGETTGRMKCHNGCDAPMKWAKQEHAPNPVCPDCNGTGKGHYAGQIGDEPTPAEFVDSLLEVTAECVRVLKPSGSLWVNLGDKYAGGGGFAPNAPSVVEKRKPKSGNPRVARRSIPTPNIDPGVRAKSLIGIPWRYALRCIDDLGLILRAEVIWSKPNGLPESVTDRVRRSHETWFHFTLQPRYFSAVDEIREPHVATVTGRDTTGWTTGPPANRGLAAKSAAGSAHVDFATNPLGKLPGSVWSVPTEPLKVPDHLGVDHFAAFPTEWPKRIIQGWSPSGVCVGCGEGRRPVVTKGAPFPVDEFAHRKRPTGKPVGPIDRGEHSQWLTGSVAAASGQEWNRHKAVNPDAITGYACACPEPTAPTTPAVVLDPFGGTGTTAMVAKALGRHGVSVDMSLDYGRLARWRTNDRNQLAKVLGVEKAEPVDEAQLDLFGGEVA